MMATYYRVRRGDYIELAGGLLYRVVDDAYHGHCMGASLTSGGYRSVDLRQIQTYRGAAMTCYESVNDYTDNAVAV